MNKAQAEPWSKYGLGDTLGRALWVEICNVRQITGCREQEKSLEGLYHELLAAADPYRWRVLEKMSAVRSELIRLDAVTLPWKGGANVGG